MIRDLVIQNRSYRGYDSARKITREELEELVDLTRYTASSVNRQPLKYALVCEPERVAAVQPCTIWAKGLPQMHLPHEGKCPTAFIVICCDHNIAASSAPFMRDVGIVAQTILLGAVEMGLGGCMIGSYKAAELSAVLALPENEEPVLVIAIGKPDEKIILTDVGTDGSTAYYRDDEDVHYVPKRSLKDILL